MALESPLEQWTDTEFVEVRKQRFREAIRLAKAGFRFSPAREGMTHGITDWPRIATSDVQKLKAWYTEYPQLVMVAFRCVGVALDIDDLQACLTRGFNLRWVEKCPSALAGRRPARLPAVGKGIQRTALEAGPRNP